MALDPTIIVATIVTVGGVGSTYLANRHHKELKRTIGDVNGEGNAMEILEWLKTWALQHEIRHTYEQQHRRPE